MKVRPFSTASNFRSMLPHLTEACKTRGCGSRGSVCCRCANLTVILGNANEQRVEYVAAAHRPPGSASDFALSRALRFNVRPRLQGRIIATARYIAGEWADYAASHRQVDDLARPVNSVGERRRP